MKNSSFLWTIVLVGISTSACGGDATGLFGASDSVTSGAGGGSTASSGQGGTPLVTSSTSGSGSTTTAASSSSGTGGGMGQGGMTAASSSSGQGGGPPAGVGCSDGTREYFMDISAQPNIAGCAGGFSIAGVITQVSMTPACNRVSGNDSSNPSGMGCSVEDLCAAGWYVCHGAMDVQAHSSTGQCETSLGTTSRFWATRQPQTTMGSCSQPPSANNVVGCGDLGEAITAMSCQPLDRRMKSTDCAQTQSWFCGPNMILYDEANIITKNGPDAGGVLCCKM